MRLQRIPYSMEVAMRLTRKQEDAVVTNRISTITPEDKDEIIRRAEPYITQGWTVDSLSTVSECEDAYTVLSTAVIQMEEQMLRAKQDAFINRVYADPDWYARCRTAIKRQKQAMQMVSTRKGVLAKIQKQQTNQTSDRRLLELIKLMFPDQFNQAVGMLHSHG